MQADFHRPGAQAPLVHAIWECRAQRPMCWRILPSAKVELLLNLGPPMTEVEGRRVGAAFNPTQRFCFLSGLHTRPLVLSFPRFHVMGVQMDPLAVRALFGLPAAEVTDWAVLGEDLLPELPWIEDSLRSLPDFAARARWLEAFVASRHRATPELDQAMRMRRAIDAMVLRAGRGERVRPEDWTGYSRMHTHRLFRTWLGVASGECIRLLRFVRAEHHLHGPVTDLTRLALEHGYYDLAHLDHHFQRYAGMSPGRYREARTDLPGQLPG